MIYEKIQLLLLPYLLSTTSRRELSSSFLFFPARQVAGGNSRHSDRNNMATCNIVCQLQTWMAQFKWGDAPRPGRPKTVIILENTDQIHDLNFDDRWQDFA